MSKRAAAATALRAKRAPGGFLLTETLAAMTISAFILAGLVSITTVMLRSVDVSVARIQETDNLARAMGAMTRDIGSLFRARWAGAEPQAFIFAGDAGSVLFPHVETSKDGARYLAVIRLQGAGDGGKLTRADAPLRSFAASRSDLHFGTPREIYSGAARIRFVYVAAAMGREPEKRLRVWSSGQTLPSAVIVEASDLIDGHVLFSSRVAVHANGDPGCLSAEFCGRLDKAQLAPPGAGPAVAPPPGGS
jgi:type II secretory pathway pseudopilin PulG